MDGVSSFDNSQPYLMAAASGVNDGNLPPSRPWPAPMTRSSGSPPHTALRPERVHPAVPKTHWPDAEAVQIEAPDIGALVFN